MRKDWSEILKGCDEREGTLEEFAREKGVSRHALSYQITRRNKAARFIPVVREESKSEGSGVTIEFPSGIRLRVQG
jgi:hypothetical protein